MVYNIIIFYVFIKKNYFLIIIKDFCKCMHVVILYYHGIDQNANI